MKPYVILKIAYSVYEKSGIRGSVPCKARYFFFSPKHPDRLCSRPILVFGGSVNLIIHSDLLLGLTDGALPPSPPCKGVTEPFASLQFVKWFTILDTADTFGSCFLECLKISHR